MCIIVLSLNPNVNTLVGREGRLQLCSRVKELGFIWSVYKRRRCCWRTRQCLWENAREARLCQGVVIVGDWDGNDGKSDGVKTHQPLTRDCSQFNRARRDPANPLQTDLRKNHNQGYGWS
jgi:hypothetical protein